MVNSYSNFSRIVCLALVFSNLAFSKSKEKSLQKQTNNQLVPLSTSIRRHTCETDFFSSYLSNNEATLDTEKVKPLEERQKTSFSTKTQFDKIVLSPSICKKAKKANVFPLTKELYSYSVLQNNLLHDLVHSVQRHRDDLIVLEIFHPGCSFVSVENIKNVSDVSIFDSGLSYQALKNNPITFCPSNVASKKPVYNRESEKKCKALSKYIAENNELQKNIQTISLEQVHTNKVIPVASHTKKSVVDLPKEQNSIQIKTAHSFDPKFSAAHSQEKKATAYIQEKSTLKKHAPKNFLKMLSRRNIKTIGKKLHRKYDASTTAISSFFIDKTGKLKNYLLGHKKTCPTLKNSIEVKSGDYSICKASSITYLEEIDPFQENFAIKALKKHPSKSLALLQEKIFIVSKVMSKIQKNSQLIQNLAFAPKSYRKEKMQLTTKAPTYSLNTIKAMIEHELASIETTITENSSAPLLRDSHTEQSIAFQEDICKDNVDIACEVEKNTTIHEQSELDANQQLTFALSTLDCSNLHLEKEEKEVVMDFSVDHSKKLSTSSFSTKIQEQIEVSSNQKSFDADSFLTNPIKTETKEATFLGYSLKPSIYKEHATSATIISDSPLSEVTISNIVHPSLNGSSLLSSNFIVKEEIKQQQTPTITAKTDGTFSENEFEKKPQFQKVHLPKQQLHTKENTFLFAPFLSLLGKSESAVSDPSILYESKRINRGSRNSHDNLGMPTLDALNTESFRNVFAIDAKVLQGDHSSRINLCFTIKKTPQSLLPALPVHVLYILDTSSTIEPHRFELFKESIIASLEMLDQNCSFNIALLENDSSTLLHEKSVRPTLSGKSFIKRALRKVKQKGKSNFSALKNTLIKEKKTSINSDIHRAAIVLSDGMLINNIRIDRENFEQIVNQDGLNYAFYTAAVSDKNNRSSLSLISKLNNGFSLYTATHASFPRRFAKMVKSVRKPLLQDIHVSFPNNADIKPMFNRKLNQTLLSDRKYTFYASAKKKEELQVFIQGRYGNKWVNIIQKLDMRNARKARKMENKALAIKKAVNSYFDFILSKDEMHLSQAKKHMEDFQ